MDFQTPPRPSVRVRFLALLHKLVPPLLLEQRAEVQVKLRDTSSPDFDFFLMVILSCVIATSGLLTDSVAVIIGAMLVAPLMSPIIGLGLGWLSGDATLVRSATSSLARGALLAVLIAAALTWVNSFLPFVTLQDLPGEVISRTHPSPIDLTIALAGGLAAAYALAEPQLSATLPGVAIATALMPPLCTVGIGVALGRWDVAGGALLLFVTNAVTIAFASMLVFFVLGFGRHDQNGNRMPSQLLVTAGLTLVLLVPLTVASVEFFQQASLNREIDSVVRQEVQRMGGELTSWTVTSNGDTLRLDITVRTFRALQYEDVLQLQRNIATRLQRTVAIVVNQVMAARLDPLVPPTLTPTPVFTPTSTLTPTASPTITSSPLPTDTVTPSLTPTPWLALIDKTNGRAVDLSQTPGGPSIAHLKPGDQLTVLYGVQVQDGLVWLEVRDGDGRIGWVPQIYLFKLTSTPTSTSTASPIPMMTPSLTATPG